MVPDNQDWIRTPSIQIQPNLAPGNEIGVKIYHLLLNNVSIIHEQSNSSIRVSVKINILKTENRKTFLQISVDQKQKISGCSFWKDICKYLVIYLVKYFQRLPHSWQTFVDARPKPAMAGKA